MLDALAIAELLDPCAAHRVSRGIDDCDRVLEARDQHTCPICSSWSVRCGGDDRAPTLCKSLNDRTIYHHTQRYRGLVCRQSEGPACDGKLIDVTGDCATASTIDSKYPGIDRGWSRRRRWGWRWRWWQVDDTTGDR